jgi:hypothetical protein
MMPGGTLLIAPTNTDISHQQMFQDQGIASDDITKFLMTVPRGYFMDGEICVYQGADMTPGAIWRLPVENYNIVRTFMPQLQCNFEIDDSTNLYLGVRVGEIGTVWQKLYKTTIGAFMR